MPEEIERAVAERDKGHCVITGACGEHEVAITWLIPPAMIDALKDASQDPRKFNNYSEACVVSNAITLRKDLIEALNDNAFGVDVEDNYRIVLFYDLGDTGKFLQGLERPFFHREDRQGPDDIFLIAHFLHCVKVHVIGGDVSDEYSLRDIEVWEDRLDDEDGAEWDDPLGAEVYEVHRLADLMYT
ncbi:hypothetical protein JR316_0009383 [Psilocybe cubensis]|nr:hypothetical protein JR316_0009383 [Psilocybe cubensis]KAH9478920.1 hypothetical protein JR316_0009383 [Psilocybe cubensis]